MLPISFIVALFNGAIMLFLIYSKNSFKIVKIKRSIEAQDQWPKIVGSSYRLIPKLKVAWKPYLSQILIGSIVTTIPALYILVQKIDFNYDILFFLCIPTFLMAFIAVFSYSFNLFWEYDHVYSNVSIRPYTSNNVL
jgi:hypothetical protein